MDDLIQQCKDAAVREMEMFLRNFAHVPDDKLHWTPTPTAKSALRIAAHTAVHAGLFAQMIRTRQLPGTDNLEAWLAARNAEEEAITDRTQMERVFRSATDEVLAALDSLSASDLDLHLHADPGGSISMRYLITLPAWHATLHTGQIDFLQTCWGDAEIYLA